MKVAYSFNTPGCRLPGNVNSPDQFWDVIKKGRCVVTESPPDRWHLESLKPVSKRGGFIKDIDQFDHTFFKISPREAASMDPQQRHLLEVTQRPLKTLVLTPGDYRVTVGCSLVLE